MIYNEVATEEYAGSVDAPRNQAGPARVDWVLGIPGMRVIVNPLVDQIELVTTQRMEDCIDDSRMGSTLERLEP
jgi:hypothetical protein